MKTTRPRVYRGKMVEWRNPRTTLVYRAKVTAASSKNHPGCCRIAIFLEDGIVVRKWIDRGAIS